MRKKHRQYFYGSVFFTKAVGRKLPVQVFFYEFCEIATNTYFGGPPQKTASEESYGPPVILLEKETTPAQLFSCEFYEIFKIMFSIRHLNRLHPFMQSVYIWMFHDILNEICLLSSFDFFFNVLLFIWCHKSDLFQ